MSDRIVNLLDLELTIDEDAPAGHRFGGRSLSGQVGAAATGMGIYELKPGQASWPYHFELSEEEWLIVLQGAVTLRTPAGESVLRAGDVACFPAGASGAHAVRNNGAETARYLMTSSVAPCGSGCVYPDSAKVFVYTEGFSHRGRLGEELPYWEGES